MQKFLSILIALSLMLCLCACGKAKQPELPPMEAVQHAAMTSSFPLGMDGELLGVCAVGDGIFVGGVQDEQAKLLRLDYTLGDSGIALGNIAELELPECAGEREFIALSRGGDKVYALFSFQAEGEKDKTYIVSVYAAGGAPESSVTLPVRENADVKSILAAEDGTLCLRELHHLSLFSPDGEPMCLITELDKDFAPPLLIDGAFVAQVGDGFSAESTLCRIDTENAALIPIDAEEMILLSYSRCQSLDELALINDGGDVYSVGKNARLTRLFNWYELTLDYGSDYRYICRIGDADLLLVPKDSGELISLHITSTVPTRTVRVAFCGYGNSQIRVLENMFRHYATDYKVESQYYSSEDADVTRLQMELGAKNGIDLLICDLPKADPSTGFVDLYPLLDADKELSREDFPGWILEGLEQNGRLNEIWGNFIISTWAALGILVSQPEPLTLWGCKDFLDSQDYDELFFDSTETKERMLSNVAYCILAAAQDENSGEYRLDTPYIRDLLEFCNTFPVEDPYKILEGNINNVDPSLWYSNITSYVMIGDMLRINDREYEFDWEKIRFFDGQNGGDNLCNLSAGPTACYLIPKTCPDVENAWGFLRSLLKSDFQTALFDVSGRGIPSNIKAYDFVVDTLSSPETKAILDYMISHSPVHTYESMQLKDILVSSIQPWFNGDASLDDALSAAQGRINIYTAERAD